MMCLPVSSCSVHGFMCRKTVHTLFHRIIFRACCALEPNTSSTFVRMRALCVYVSVFLYHFEVHVFSAFKIFCCRIFFLSEEIRNPKFIYFPKGVGLPRDCEIGEKYRMVLNSMSYIEKSTLQMCCLIFPHCSFSYSYVGF